MSARDAILAKLRAAPRRELPRPDLAGHFRRFADGEDEVARLRRWAAAMRAAKTEILWTREADWDAALAGWLDAHPQPSLLLPDAPHGRRLARRLEGGANPPRIVCFDREVDDWKAELFDVAAAFTIARCGIAATGTLVLWPDETEPRTMSLVPPLHIALFDAAALYPDFYSAMEGGRWADGMPTNALLISGPSKTADIQQTLAYGAHGPRELLVVALVPPHVALAELEGGGR
ncbi:LutC/YkgG family protein [Chromobacterium sp. CV08]|uniref:LutC/YkgG family protein n=1 Tax=Chromobacterium sp. CV08 TaxID=3133274 RepID=UPI003DA9202A